MSADFQKSMKTVESPNHTPSDSFITFEYVLFSCDRATLHNIFAFIVERLFTCCCKLVMLQHAIT